MADSSKQQPPTVADTLAQPGFHIVCADDPDMAGGIEAYGKRPDGVVRTRQEFMEDFVKPIYSSDEWDPRPPVLLSYRNACLFQDMYDGDISGLIFRANNTTDIWGARGATYQQLHARPHAAVDLPAAAARGLKVCLFSVTLCGDLDHDIPMLEAYSDFCMEASDLGLQHILEIFNPQHGPVAGLDGEGLGSFMNDSIVRLIASQEAASGPIFLKIPFNSHATMEALARHDSELNVGILGGASGTSRDAFELVSQAKECGARAAFFGRRIKNAASPMHMLACLGGVAEGTGPSQAVADYHQRLKKDGIASPVTEEEDNEVTLDFLKERAS